MKDFDTMSKEREERINLSHYKDLIETISKVEYRRFSNLGLIDLSEVISLATYTAYYIVNNTSSNKQLFNEAYLTKAIKWAIRNEMRRRYRWYVMRNNEPQEQEKIKDAVYRTILSIDEMADADNPTLIKDLSRTPEEKAHLRKKMERKRFALKEIKNFLSTLRPIPIEEQLENYKCVYASEKKEQEQQNPKIVKVLRTKMDDVVKQAREMEEREKLRSALLEFESSELDEF